jgi:hypothetical protein
MNIDELTLLPRPRSLGPAEGAFAVGSSTEIRIGSVPRDATQKTARGLQAALVDCFGFSPRLVTSHEICKAVRGRASYAAFGCAGSTGTGSPPSSSPPSGSVPWRHASRALTTSLMSIHFWLMSSTGI